MPVHICFELKYHRYDRLIVEGQSFSQLTQSTDRNDFIYLSIEHKFIMRNGMTVIGHLHTQKNPKTTVCAI